MWEHLESNQGHKDFQSFALPTELCHQCCFASANIGHFYKSAIVLRVFFIFFHFLV